MSSLDCDVQMNRYRPEVSSLLVQYKQWEENHSESAAAANGNKVTIVGFVEQDLASPETVDSHAS